MSQETYSLNNVAGVYTIIHEASGRTYVGEALNIRTRWKGHFNSLQAGSHRNYFLQNSWNKYGAEAFKFKVFLILERIENESDFMLKKRLKQEENKVLKFFPNNFNLEICSDHHEYLIPGPMAKAQMKKAAKAERNSPGGKARMKQVRLNAMNDPTATLNHKLGTKAGWQDPIKKAKRITAFNTEEGKKNRAEGAKIGWLKRKEKLQTDSNFLLSHKKSREKANKKIKELYNLPERKEKLSKQSTESWKVSGRKEKVSASLKEFYSDPNNRKLHSARMKKAYSCESTPEKDQP